ncbi:MAG: phosphoribosylformylglycinamidine synthase, partial [Candidatus Eisenbacteria bacterium]|nr:phosphoribosylformylglycinamidine synthase [Candidatus Eisenbacteria bacterium]
SSFEPLALPADWIVWVGYLPGVKDAPGETAREAIEDLLGRPLAGDEACYTSKLHFVRARREPAGEGGGPDLAAGDLELLARELLANDLVQRWQLWRVDRPGGAGEGPRRPPEEPARRWNPAAGVGWMIPRVDLRHRPRVQEIQIGSDEELLRISAERHLFLDPRDVPTIREYYSRPEVRRARRAVGLDLPTDVEIEYIAQARSDHCNHNTFRGLFRYRDATTGERFTLDSLFRTCIEAPTLAVAAGKDWVVSVLWDNAGVGRFDERHCYTITGETHNSPSNMEAYGGSLTGIVGVYRDPLGTGKGSRLVLGTFGYCVGPRDYPGPLRPRLHPRRLLDGVIEGVRDGGNKSGIPTPFGQVFFDESYLGKCLVYVTAVGLMPAEVDGARSDRKRTSPGDLVVMCGGRVGKDGIHGVTASSHIYSERTPAGHVQIGDPYTQKKMHDFLIAARDRGWIRFITDCGGGGLSSAVGESARFAGGVTVDLDQIPLKYQGLDPWEVWVSESQERMVVAVGPGDAAAFLELAGRHAVEATVIGRYTDSGHVHLLHQGRSCAYIALDLFESDFPQWEFEAEWRSPEDRGLVEPVLSEPEDHHRCLLAMLARPNVAAKEWIYRQYDHEVQGGSVVKPLVGVHRDVPADAAVVRPVLDSLRGLAITQAINPTYSRIDAHAMTAVTIDEAVRRLIAAGGDPDHIGGIDNFCWPEIRHDDERNPDGRLKAAQLVRSCLALKACCLAYGIPLLSGKDSMYIDGSLAGRFGERHRVSGLPALQFTATSVVPDVRRCVTLDPKRPGEILYLLGTTRDELGGSEYYGLHGLTGCRVPRVDPHEVFPMYRALAGAIAGGGVAAAHAVHRGGLGVHLAWMAMAGGLGLEVELARVPCASDGAAAILRNDVALYSESAGRLLVTVPAEGAAGFEARMQEHPCAAIGRVTESGRLTVRSVREGGLIDLPIETLRESWRRPFGHLA